MSATPSTGPAGDSLPRMLGPLQLVRRLGAGAMGTVYAATLAEPLGALPVGASVAAKVFREDAIEGAGGAQGLERLRREARVGMRIDHPAVVRTHHLLELEAGDGASLPTRVLVMELVEGPTLRQLVDDLGSLPEPLLRHLAWQLACALDAVHQAGVVHRDIKPENVLVAADRQVKLTDLGIARPLGGSDILTAKGAFLGSLAYASPESTSAPETSRRAATSTRSASSFTRPPADAGPSRTRPSRA